MSQKINMILTLSQTKPNARAFASHRTINSAAPTQQPTQQPTQRQLPTNSIQHVAPRINTATARRGNMNSIFASRGRPCG
jgi:hypothetical protein